MDVIRGARLLAEVLGMVFLGLLFVDGAYAVLSLFASIGGGALGGLLSPNAWELLRLAAGNVALFSLPLFAYGATRRCILGALRRCQLRREPWARVLLLSLGLILGAYVLSYLSECVLDFFPASWGISAEDAVAKELEHLLVVAHWYDPFVMIFALALVPAISEELYFRAYLQRRLIRLSPRRYWISIVVVSVLFSLIHASLVGFLSRLFLSLGMGYAYYRRGNIALPVFIHFLNNLITLAFYIKF